MLHGVAPSRIGLDHKETETPAMLAKLMDRVVITRQDFLRDRQGRTFADVLSDSEHVFDAVLAFLSDDQRQRRMQESEMHHDRAPLAGVVRELETQPSIDDFLSSFKDLQVAEEYIALLEAAEKRYPKAAG